MRPFGRRVGIDLGTVNTLISLGGKVVLNQPSVVAVDVHDGEVRAVGMEAYRMLGRTPSNVSAVYPVRNGVIADFDLTEKMVNHFLRMALRRRFFKPSVVVGIASGATSIERRAVVDVLYGAGAREVSLVQEQLAAAIGAGVPIWDARGQLLVDIGGGTSDVVVISLGAVVYGSSVRVGGNAIDDAIASHIRKCHGVIIGATTAEALKREVASVRPTGQRATVCGQHLVTGLPTSVEVTADELVVPISDFVRAVVATVRATLEKTPPELSGDILSNGIVLTGGGALLRGLPELIASETGLPTQLAEDSLCCVVRGAGAIAEAASRYRRVTSRQRRLA